MSIFRYNIFDSFRENTKTDQIGTSRKKQAEELRIDERYYTNLPGFLTGRTESGQTFNITNISFGGFATNSSINQQEIISPCHTRIIFPGKSARISVHSVHHSEDLSGFRFDHKVSDAQPFLREILEGMHIGAGFRILDKTFLQEKYWPDFWICLRAESTATIRLRLGKNGEAEYLNLTYLWRSKKRVVIFDRESLMTPDSQEIVDDEMCSQSLSILLGVRKTLTGSAIQNILECFSSKLSDSSD